MTLYPSQGFQIEAKNNGWSNTQIGKALDYIQKLESQGLPVIFSLKHLTLYTGISYKFARKIISRRTRPYKIFQMRKMTGGKRNISIPEPTLATLQRWITRNISYKVKTHYASHAYNRGDSIRKCAMAHCPSQWLIKIDIQQFFESISEIKVYQVFRNLGYTRLLSLEMARLCTTVLERNPENSQRWTVTNLSYDAIKNYRTHRLGSLPQGAPSSPMLSNLVCLKLDGELQELANRQGMVYTRYADDMAFSSSDKHFGRQRASKVIREVYSILLRNGFRPKTTKTHLIPPGFRKIVLGLNVDRDKPYLSKEMRATIQRHFYAISKHGFAEVSNHYDFSNPLSFYYHLEGLVRFAHSVQPEFSERYFSELKKINIKELVGMS